MILNHFKCLHIDVECVCLRRTTTLAWRLWQLRSLVHTQTNERFTRSHTPREVLLQTKWRQKISNTFTVNEIPTGCAIAMNDTAHIRRQRQLHVLYTLALRTHKHSTHNSFDRFAFFSFFPSSFLLRFWYGDATSTTTTMSYVWYLLLLLILLLTTSKDDETDDNARHRRTDRKRVGESETESDREREKENDTICKQQYILCW